MNVSLKSKPAAYRRLESVSCLRSPLRHTLTCFLDRIAGAASEINALKEAYNRGIIITCDFFPRYLQRPLGESPTLPDTDIHAVCDLVESWFRVLPEPVFSASSYYEIMQKVCMCRILLEVFSRSLICMI
jgi:hypothetical protein